MPETPGACAHLGTHQANPNSSTPVPARLAEADGHSTRLLGPWRAPGARLWGWDLRRQLWPGGLLRGQVLGAVERARVGSEAMWAHPRPMASSSRSCPCQARDVTALSLWDGRVASALSTGTGFVACERNDQATSAFSGSDIRRLTRVAAGLEFLAVVQVQSPERWVPSQLPSPVSAGCLPRLVPGFAGGSGYH